jgi:hypothetical protein
MSDGDLLERSLNGLLKDQHVALLGYHQIIGDCHAVLVFLVFEGWSKDKGPFPGPSRCLSTSRQLPSCGTLTYTILIHCLYDTTSDSVTRFLLTVVGLRNIDVKPDYSLRILCGSYRYRRF